MISAKRASMISLERDREKREALIDKLTEQDAKHILKMTLRVLNGEAPEVLKQNDTKK